MNRKRRNLSSFDYYRPGPERNQQQAHVRLHTQIPQHRRCLSFNNFDLDKFKLEYEQQKKKPNLRPKSSVLSIENSGEKEIRGSIINMEPNNLTKYYIKAYQNKIYPNQNEPN